MKQQQGPLRLNLGCEDVCPDGWVNVDGSNRAWLASKWSLVDRLLVGLKLIAPTEFDRNTLWADLTRTFPWPDDSVDAIYMGELLEHFTQETGREVLLECRRVLKPDGILRIRVPDNARFWKNYLREYAAIKQRPRAEWNTAHTRWIEMFFRNICTSKPKPFHSMGHCHKWMYDDVSLVCLLESLGFREADRMEFHESRIPGIDEVEVREDLIVEAVK